MSNEKQYPSLGQQAKNLAGFSWELVKYIHESKGGALMVSDEHYQKRTSICKSCPKFDDSEKRCMECGCFIPAKAKIILDSCPLNKWEDMSSEWENKLESIMQEVENEQQS